MPQNAVVSLKLTDMTYEEASTIPYGATMALNLLKKPSFKKGNKY